MSASPPPPSLIDDIDVRQNQILDQLDELNTRVEQVLRELNPPPEEDEQALPGEPATSGARSKSDPS